MTLLSVRNIPLTATSLFVSRPSLGKQYSKSLVPESSVLSVIISNLQLYEWATGINGPIHYIHANVGYVVGIIQYVYKPCELHENGKNIFSAIFSVIQCEV